MPMSFGAVEAAHIFKDDTILDWSELVLEESATTKFDQGY